MNVLIMDLSSYPLLKEWYDILITSILENCSFLSIVLLQLISFFLSFFKQKEQSHLKLEFWSDIENKGLN